MNNTSFNSVTPNALETILASSISTGTSACAKLCTVSLLSPVGFRIKNCISGCNSTLAKNAALASSLLSALATNNAICSLSLYQLILWNTPSESINAKSVLASALMPNMRTRIANVLTAVFSLVIF